MVERINPYALICRPTTMDGQPTATYPLTTAVAVAPLAAAAGLVSTAYQYELTAALIIGLSVATLAYGLLRTGEPWRLWLLVSFPAVQCVQVANWSMLILAAWYVPALAALMAIKPHVGIVAALRHPWPAMAGAGALGALSLLLWPSWPFDWLATTGGYSGRPLALLLPIGPLLLALLALRRAWWGVALALVPLRPFYDWLLCAILVTSQRQMLLWVAASWAAYGAWFAGLPLWAAAAICWAPAMFVLRWRLGGAQKAPAREQAPTVQ